jgi:photosystem II stability/assembly factor-like uncharacterized protein
MNVRYHRSTDGGKTYETFNTPHGHHHDLWIAPEDPNRMIIADDGGAQVTYDGGENWSTYENQPTAQFYRVTVDDAFPYRIYGAQQDNSTVRIPHRTSGRYIDDKDWESTAGGESAHLAVKPDDDEIVYGGSYDGFLTRRNHRTNEVRAVNVWPDNPMGHGAEGMKYRFQWNFPIFFSPHDPNKLYTASNHLHVTTNGGQSWEIISPDLTRNDSTKLGPSGGPITKDNTSVEYYCTIFAAAESHHEAGVIWTGSDDGLLHLTRDGGKTWKNVNPDGMPEWMMINSVEIDPFNKGGLYIAGTRYKMGDYQPYIYKTTDYGKSWVKIVDGISSEHFTRVVRADPDRKGLLYAGTEAGMYISFDDGASWNSFQMNLPIVPITDLAIKNKNLIAATQGRSFWVLDDLTPLHQMQEEVNALDFYLFEPMDTYIMGGGNGATSRQAGTNHPGGALIHFHLQDTTARDTLALEFYTADGQRIRSYSTHPDKEAMEGSLEVKPGMNVFNWNMRYPGAKTFEGMILWWATTSGPVAVPGTYEVRLVKNGEEMRQGFDLMKDPRVSASQEDLQAQFDFLIQVRDKLSETHEAIIKLRKARKQIREVLNKSEDSVLMEMGQAMIDEMTTIEKRLYQTQNESAQDPLNFPIRLNNKLGHLASLAGVGSNRPTDSMVAFYKEVTNEIQKELDRLEVIFTDEVERFNQKVLEAKIKAIQLED